MRVGVIGLGLMGGGIGRNLLRKGFPLAVYDVDQSAIRRLVDAGAAPASSPREVAAQADVVLTVLPDGPDVEAAILGTEGGLGGARAKTIFIDCSTVDPTVTQRVGHAVRAAGCGMVDVGMSRTFKDADDGTLLLMVGATPEDYQAVQPVLSAMGTDVFHCGGPGTGITMKLVNNLLSITIYAADAEALVLGAKAGLDTDLMLKILSSTAAGNAHLQLTVREQLLTGDYEPGFKAVLAHKDLGLAQNMAARLGVPLLALSQTRQLYTLALAQGKGDHAHGVIGAVLEQIVGVRIGKD